MSSVYSTNLVISWKAPVANAAALPPTGNADGDARVDVSTDTIYVWHEAGSNWLAVATPGAAIALDGLNTDVSASGPGVVAATVNSVGGSTAANVHSAELLANAATDLNTASAIVKRDVSGNFAANAITAVALETPDITDDSADTNSITVQTGSNTFVGGSVQNTGGLTFISGSIADGSGNSTGSNVFKTGDALGTNPGGPNSGSFTFQTGNAANASGNLAFVVGTGLTRGKIQFQDGSQGTAGYVWTSTDASGSGHWASGAIGTIGIASGGTGQTTELAAINALTSWNTSSVIIGTGAQTVAGVTTSAIFGYQAGLHLTTGHGNTLIGQASGQQITGGTDNTFVGNTSGPQANPLTTGNRNSGFGTASLSGLNTGASFNTGVGYGSLDGVTTGSSNTGVGYTAGASFNTGSNNTAIGAAADISGNFSNSTAIGANTTVAANNRVVIGNGVNVGIDSAFSTNPTARLSLPGGTASASTAPLKIHSGTLMTTHEAGAIENDGTSLYYTNDVGTRAAIGGSSLPSPAIIQNPAPAQPPFPTSTIFGVTSASDQAHVSVIFGSTDVSTDIQTSQVSLACGSLTGINNTLGFINGVEIYGGSCASGSVQGGPVLVISGSSDSAAGADIQLTPGNSNSSTGGNLQLNVGTGSANGNILNNGAACLTNTNQTITAGGSIVSTTSFTALQAAGALSTSTSTVIVAGRAPGQTLVIVNVGAQTITLKAGGNTDLPSLTDYPLTASSSISFIWFGSTWYCTGASVN